MTNKLLIDTQSLEILAFIKTIDPEQLKTEITVRNSSEISRTFEAITRANLTPFYIAGQADNLLIRPGSPYKVKGLSSRGIDIFDEVMSELFNNLGIVIKNPKI